ncbi:MAG: PASTA domain-containing protein [Acidimicrobiales bacterium]
MPDITITGRTTTTTTTDKTLGGAESALVAAGLEYEVFSSPTEYCNGVYGLKWVVGQTPAPGTVVPVGTVVFVTTCNSTFAQGS